MTTSRSLHPRESGSEGHPAFSGPRPSGNSALHDVAKGTGNNISAMQVYIDNKLVKSICVFANAYTETVQTAMQVYTDNQLKQSDGTLRFVDHTFSEAPVQHYVVVKAWDADGHSVLRARQ